MIIRRMTANFGTLHNEELRLSEGLNIIEMPNESGKSTWCAFLRAMLYGVDSAQREKGGIKPDRERYKPWSGAPMEGVMEITAEDRDIVLRRGTRNANAPMRQFSAVYADTGAEVPELSGQDAGERLIGVPAGVFERSAFIRQSSLCLDDGDGELEKRITAMITSGEEEGVSYTAADERLRAWQRRLRYKGRGRIPALEAEISELRGLLATLKGSVRELENLEEEAEVFRLRRDSLLGQVEESRRLQRKETLERLTESRGELRRLTSAAEERRTAVKESRIGLEATVFAGAEPHTLKGLVAADADEAAEAEKLGKRVPSPLGWILALCAALAFAASGILLKSYLFLPAAAATGLALWLGLNFLRARRRAAESAALCRGMLEKYGVASPGEIPALFEDYAGRYGEFLRAAEALREAEEALAAAMARQKELDGAILQELDFDAGETDAAKLSRRLAETEKELRGLWRTCDMARGRLDSLGDPLVLSTRLRTLEDEYTELLRRYDALELAGEALREADTELQKRFSPRLARRTAALLSRLTEGRYTELTLDRKLTAELRRAGDAVPHGSAFLSRGALDQFYLALRLALCELTLPESPLCPLILDDALVSFDDERMGLALDLLDELSAQRQILLFTCQRREADYMERKRKG